MFEHKQLQELAEYFLDLNKRSSKGVFFYRLNGYSQEVGAFVKRYYEAARLTGVVIEGKIPNPTEKNLEYYAEMMGMEFQHSLGFISASLRKWLPRMNENQRRLVSEAIYDTLDLMRKEGKNENMLKNAYIKFMCWLYYKFERVVGQLGNNQIPKLLYEGAVSIYELKMFSILSKSGCDIVLLQYQGDADYLKLDSRSESSRLYQAAGLNAFPEQFSLKKIKDEIALDLKRERLYGSAPQFMNCTNAWITGTGLEDFMKPPAERGDDPHLYYNAFYRFNGVEDKLTCMNEWYQFYLQMKNRNRNIIIENHEIPRPSPEEIAAVRRKNYTNIETMLQDMIVNILYPASNDLQKLMKKAFIDVMLEAGGGPDEPVNKLVNKAVYLLCWLKRYQGDLFRGWRYPETACFIYFGRCRDENEALFLKLLARLPVDVMILNHRKAEPCCLADPFLYEVNYPEAIEAEKFPSDNTIAQVGTAAYHAERELDTLMYQDSGLYRNQQCSKATSVVLKTMYEEIFILWDQELKYRPSFSVVEDVVSIPVIFAKISGVKDGNVSQYWAMVKRLLTDDAIYVRHVPAGSREQSNPMTAHATGFLKNGKLQREKIKAHKDYPYRMLRTEMQEHLLDKLQLLLDQKLIKGTYENGTEYVVVASVLNLDKAMIRKIQQFDFTKKNPKAIYINSLETIISLEDGIKAAFLSLVGFDVLFFVPTGYQSVENHFNKNLVEEHQAGTYLYDMRVPNFDSIPLNYRNILRKKIFKRGN